MTKNDILTRLDERVGYNKEQDRYFIELEYLGENKEGLTEHLSDFIYKWSDEIGTDNAYTFTAYAIQILKDEVLPYSETESNILDNISQSADSYVPIYYHEIGEWLKDNIFLVDEVKEELGSTGDTYKDTQQAYFITLEKVTMDLHELVKELAEEE